MHSSKQDAGGYEVYCNQLFRTYNSAMIEDIINEKYYNPDNNNVMEKFTQTQANSYDGLIHTINIDTDQE